MLRGNCSSAIKTTQAQHSTTHRYLIESADLMSGNYHYDRYFCETIVSKVIWLQNPALASLHRPLALHMHGSHDFEAAFEGVKKCPRT